MLRSDALQRKLTITRTLAEQLNEWEVPYDGRYDPTFHYVLEVQRLRLMAFWKPVTRSFFEAYTDTYRGPHIPLMASKRRFKQNKDWYYDERVEYIEGPFYVAPEHGLLPPIRQFPQQ